jgi:hypothetical protein
MDYFKRYKVLIWVVIVLIFTNGALILVLFQQNRPIKNLRDEHRERREELRKHYKNHHNFLEEELRLSKEQRTVYRESRKQHKIEVNSMIDKIKGCKKRLHTELYKKHPDTIQVGQLIDSIGMLAKDLEYLNFIHLKEIRKTLSDQQLEQFKKFTEKMHRRINRHCLDEERNHRKQKK